MQKQINVDNLPHIGIDVMGSDTDPSRVLDFLGPILASMQGLATFTLFGKPEYKKHLSFFSHVTYVDSPESIDMQEDPLTACKSKKNSSLSLGIQALQEKQIDAFICMGNTGALIAMARLHIKSLPEVSHPPLTAPIPTKKGLMAVLDVGANIEYTHKDLVQFAAMGMAYQKLRGIETPRVALLNIGEEPLKGPKEMQKAHQTLTSLSSCHSYPFFLGNMEARDVFTRGPDVLITGGFAGNIFLKTAEGMSQFLLEKLPPSKEGNPFNYTTYPGATLCGLPRIVIKCHGNAGSCAVEQSILQAVDWIKKDFSEKIHKEISQLFSAFH